MKPDRISSPIDSFESKWWYKLPDRIPAASAISRTGVARYPFCANSSAAIATMSARGRARRRAHVGPALRAQRPVGTARGGALGHGLALPDGSHDVIIAGLRPT